jgi:hypothetical protein
MSNTTVWCWRLSIIVRDEYADDDDPVIEIIPIDKYTDDIVDDLYAHNNWLYDEHRWYIADTDLVELPRKDIHNPRWLGFKQLYDDGRYLSIDFWDWEKGNQREKKEEEVIKEADRIEDIMLTEQEKLQRGIGAVFKSLDLNEANEPVFTYFTTNGDGNVVRIPTP